MTNPTTTYPDYPQQLQDLEVNDTFEMLGYEHVYRVVQLPETYQLASGRTPLLEAYKRHPEWAPDLYIITVTPDGDGTHRPILGPDGAVFLMGMAKPVRRVPSKVEAMPPTSLESLASLIRTIKKVGKKRDKEFYSSLRYFEVFRWLRLIARGAEFKVSANNDVCWDLPDNGAKS